MTEFLTAVKEVYTQFDASHDFAHIERVLQNAKTILASEPQANKQLVEYAILLHDVSDAKYSDSKEAENRLIAMLNLTADDEAQVRYIIEAISFNGGNEAEATTIEAKIARDADRLDAIGAVGIARTFAFGGAKGRKLYDDSEIIRDEMTEEAYRNKKTASVTHFYEKLLKLKDLMVTAKGKELAEERHKFMALFLQQLQSEKAGEL